MVVLLHKVLIQDQGSLVQAQQVALILVLHSQPHQVTLTLDQLHLEICHPTLENRLIKIF
jgi:hypothetical protein